jgi:hypothetical protein
LFTTGVLSAPCLYLNGWTGFIHVQYSWKYPS